MGDTGAAVNGYQIYSGLGGRVAAWLFMPGWADRQTRVVIQVQDLRYWARTNPQRGTRIITGESGSVSGWIPSPAGLMGLAAILRAFRPDP